MGITLPTPLQFGRKRLYPSRKERVVKPEAHRAALLLIAEDVSVAEGIESALDDQPPPSLSSATLCAQVHPPSPITTSKVFYWTAVS